MSQLLKRWNTRLTVETNRCSNIYASSVILLFILLLIILWISHGWQKVKGFKSLPALTFPLKIGPQCILIIRVWMSFSEYLCLCMSLLHPTAFHPPQNTTPDNQNAIITLCLSRKKRQVYKNLFAKGHSCQSSSLPFHFHFAQPSFSPVLHHRLPTPSVARRNISLLTSGEACLSFQSSCSEQLLDRLFWSEFLA